MFLLVGSGAACAAGGCVASCCVVVELMRVVVLAYVMVFVMQVGAWLSS